MEVLLVPVPLWIATGSMLCTTVVCTAATDGDGATDSNSASVSLGNRSPSISRVYQRMEPIKMLN